MVESHNLQGALATTAVAAVIAAIPAAAIAGSPPGSLDPSFGDHGKVVTKLGTTANAVAIGDHRRIVVAGGPPFAVARYRPNGQLDDSFSKNGKARTRFRSFRPKDFAANAVAIGDRGKVVAVGGAVDKLPRGRTPFLIARYKPNGRLDHSFSKDGKLIVRGPVGFETEPGARAVAIDSEGRIVVAGRGGDWSWMFRLHRDGRLDRSFGESGIVKGPFLAGFTSLAIDSNGRIIAGTKTDQVRRYLPNGDLDRSFGEQQDGIAYMPTDGPQSATLDDRGRILNGGGCRKQGCAAAITRVTKDGQLDRSFASNGFVFSDVALRVAVDSRRRIVAFGSVPPGGGSRLELERFLPSGKPDRSFGRHGKVTTDLPGKQFLPGGVAIDRKDRIVGVGGAKKRFALTRYLGY